MTVLLVALAGAGGVLARYGLSSLVHGDALPWITVGINIVGSFLLEVLVVAHWASPQVRTTLGVGFLGGFTTFSTLRCRRSWISSPESRSEPWCWFLPQCWLASRLQLLVTTSGESRCECLANDLAAAHEHRGWAGMISPMLAVR
jgi:hypothetical protein